MINTNSNLGHFMITGQSKELNTDVALPEGKSLSASLI